MADLSASIQIGIDAGDALRDAQRLDNALESLRDRAQSVGRAMRRAFDVGNAWVDARSEISNLDTQLKALQNTLNGVERRAERAADAVASIGGSFQGPVDNLMRFQRALDGIERRAQRTAQVLSTMAANATQTAAATAAAGANPQSQAGGGAANPTASANAQNALGVATQNATGGITQLTSAIGDLARRANAAARLLGRSASGIPQGGGGAAATGTVGVAGGAGGSSPQISTGGVSNALGGIRRSAVELGQAFSRLNQNTGQLEETFENLFMVLAAGLALADVARAGIELHAYGQTLESVTQTTEEANRAWDVLTTQSDRLGIFVNDLKDNFAQFIVAGRSAGLTLDETSAVFFNFAEAMESTGAPIDQVQAGLEALQDIMTSGALDESSMAALQKAFPAAMQTMADAVAGGDFSRLKEMIEEEMIGGRDAVLAFVATAQQKFPLSVDAASQAANEFGRFRNAFEELKQTVANGGFLDSLAQAARDLTSAFRSEEIRTMATSLGQDLGGAVQTLTPYLITAVKHIDDLALALGGLIAFKLTAWAAGIASSLGGIAVAAAANWPVVLAAGVAGAGAAFVYFLRETGSVEGALGRLGDMAKTAASKFDEMTGISDKVRSAFKALDEASGGKVSTATDAINESLSKVGEAAEAARPHVVSFFEKFGSDFMAGINRDIGAIGTAIGDLGGVLSDASGRFQSFSEFVIGTFNKTKASAIELADKLGMKDLTFEKALGESGRWFALMGTGFSNLDRGMSEFVGKNLNNLKLLEGGLSNFVGSGISGFRDLMGGMHDFVSKGAEGVNSLESSMREFVGKTSSHIAELVKKIAEFGSSVLGIDFGPIMRKAEDFKNSLSEAFNAVKQRLVDVGQTIASAINFDIVQRSVDAFSTGISQAIELVRTAANGVAGFFAPALGALDAFASKVQSVWNWMKGNAPPMPDAGGIQLQSGSGGFGQRSGFQNASFITSDVMPTGVMSEGEGAVAPKPERVIRNAPRVSPRAMGAEGKPEVVEAFTPAAPGALGAAVTDAIAGTGFLSGAKLTSLQGGQGPDLSGGGIFGKPVRAAPGTPRPRSTRGGGRVAGGLNTPNPPRTGPTGGKAVDRTADLTKKFNEQLSELQAQARGLQGISAAYDQGTAAAGKFRREQDLLEKVQRLNSEFKPKQVEALRTELEKIQNLEIDVQFKQDLAELDDRVNSTKQLSEAQAQGGDAVREAQASIEAYNQAVRMGIADDEGRVASLKEKHKALLDVQAAAAVDAQVRGLNLQAEDTVRLSDAIRSGSSYAVQEAEIENASLGIGRQLGVENDPGQMDRIRQAQKSVFDQNRTLEGESRIRDMEIELEMVNRLAAAESLNGAAREGAMARIQAEAELKRQNIDVTTELSQRELELAEALGRAKTKGEEFNDALSQMARSGGNGLQALRDATASSLGHLEDALVGLVTGTMSAKEAFRSMAASIAADLARIAIRQMIIAPIAGMMGGFMMERGGIVGPGGSMPVRAFAQGGSMFTPTGVGGVARQPKMSLFGEGDHDEAYIPLTAPGGQIPLRQMENGDVVAELPGGRSIPAEMKKFAQGGVMETLPDGNVPAMAGNSMPAIPPGEGGDTTNISPNITVNVQMPQGGGSQEEGMRFGQAISRQIESRVIEIMRSQMRPGGTLNPNGGY